MDDLARQRFQHRTRAFDGVVLTADHERQRARGGALDAAGHRCVELCKAAFDGLLVDVAGIVTEMVDVSMNSAPPWPRAAPRRSRP